MSLLDEKPKKIAKKDNKVLGNQGVAGITETITEFAPNVSIGAAEVTTDIAIKENFEPACYNKPLVADNVGSIHIQPNEVKLSLVKIVQPTSKIGTPGNFLNVDSGEEFNKLEGYILALQRGYVNFGDRDAKEPYLCASRDTVKCIAYDGQVKLSKECKFNPLTWVWDSSKTPSPCHFSYSFIFNSLDDEVFLLSMHQPTSYDAIKTFITAIGTKSTGRNVMKSGLTPGKFYLYPVTISLKEDKNDKGRYYTVAFKIEKELITKEDETFLSYRANTYATISGIDKLISEKEKVVEDYNTEIDTSEAPF